MAGLTKAQREVLAEIANCPMEPCVLSGRELAILRRLEAKGLTREGSIDHGVKWAATPAGRLALQQEAGHG